MTQPTTPTVTVVEAAARLQATTDPGPLVVDVRERNEFGVMRVPGSVLLPLSTFTSTYDQLPTDRPLLMLCAVGGRSARATDFLRANGYTEAVNIAGGITAWNAAGLAIRTGTPEAGEGDLPGD
jgi:rhodanese-related sulfurtransferase